MINNDLNFEYMEDLVDCIVGEVEGDEDKFVAVVAKFDEMKEILQNIMKYDNINFEWLQIESPTIDNYYDEFVLSLWANDDVVEIGCEKLKDKDGRYVPPYGDVTFLFSNCNSKIISLCEDSELYFVNIDDDECECSDECSCQCSDHNGNDDIYGFTINNETNNGHSNFTYYSSSPIDKTDIQNILKEFGF